MEPDALTPSHQGTGTKKADKTGKTVPEDSIPPDNREMEGIRENPTEGAVYGGGNTEHNPRHRKDRPEQGVNHGLHS